MNAELAQTFPVSWVKDGFRGYTPSQRHFRVTVTGAGGLSSEVDANSREENASIQKDRALSVHSETDNAPGFLVLSEL